MRYILGVWVQRGEDELNRSYRTLADDLAAVGGRAKLLPKYLIKSVECNVVYLRFVGRLLTMMTSLVRKGIVCEPVCAGVPCCIFMSTIGDLTVTPLLGGGFFLCFSPLLSSRCLHFRSICRLLKPSKSIH